MFGPTIAQRLIDYFSGSLGRRAQAFPELTQREGEVLELIARGESNAAIARELGVSQKTVRNHVSNVFTKLRVADRSQAIVKAREGRARRRRPPPRLIRRLVTRARLPAERVP